ncbi:unnamed protein product [Sphenostylis stenocarpa]|uniref:B-like cyclin n=1 Tax=Sphenostylis stenocarpa TaxID=92480 RepID=A0AA86W4D0_9FABA|nr:unnamed protein product [Sphenostylis stenocarpa]
MVSLTGKSRVGSTRASVVGGAQSRPSVGGRNFKVFSENDRTKVGDGKTCKFKGSPLLVKGVLDCWALRTKLVLAASCGLKWMGLSEDCIRSTVIASKGVILNTTSNPKGGLKNSMDKSSGKYGTSENTAARKALVDVSNVQENFTTTVGHANSKMKVSAGSSTKIVGVSLRKSITGRVQRNTSKGDAQLDAQNRAKATTNRRDSSQLIDSRSHLWKNRVSDGFVLTVQPNVLHASSRKSAKPIINTILLKASTAQRTLKSKSIPAQSKLKSTIATSSQNKPLSAKEKLESTTATLSQEKETVSLSLPSNGSTVSDDANQRHLPSGESDLSTDLSEFIPRKKSSRRKSYTTSLIEGSKFLKESEVREQDNLPNIDNESNQFEVSEYIDDIYQYYWITEARNPALANYMSIQTDITPQLRGILINWLIEVHFKFELMPETLYLTVTLLDQYLSLVTIEKTDMQLVGLTALLLASKYEDFWHPRVKDLISISAGYTRDQMLGMEKLILRKLNFRLNTPTHYVFLVRFLKAGRSNKKVCNAAWMVIEHMAFFLVDLCLVEYEALAFKPSLLCASALYVARCTLRITPPWTPLLQKHARYEFRVISIYADSSIHRDCAEMILKFHKTAGVGKLTVAYDKYSRQELGRVAAIKPLEVLPVI